MIEGLNYQYLTNVEKGNTVTHGDKHYRVQDDGKGYHLHIIVQQNGSRKKVSIEQLRLKAFEPGSTADYIFNEWWKIYNNENQYRQFACAEIAWINM